MGMLQYKNIYVSYFYQGQSSNGHGIWVLNYFKMVNDRFLNINDLISEKNKLRLDKNYNIKTLKFDDIERTIKKYIDEYLKEI